MNYPKYIIYNNTEIPINWDFRAGIEFEKLIYDSSISEEERLIKILENYFKLLPKIDEPHLLINEILKFYRCGKELPRINEEDDVIRKKQAYDFVEDWGYIHAAFLQQYRVDLNTVKNLHWWQFKGMFESLDENTQFKKILGFRLIKIDSKMSKEQKKYYNEMKEIYKLPDKRTQEEIDEEFANAFF
ncbi:hypothetical protein HMPREF9709_01186 [Helcococcus kunzii ATCC 51366]|uniref:Bacteriophage Gp15 protein n=1 Tax=Helcococcus kunzii ATCC 51366 TaxID=883114 RepID=H3NPC5_9FIRM|nr:Gp15 family bacteriophage protein [Helcococcus kunzii]EHR33438.1 hypothetical protein HMPREF9709_01186 [Helcococcus kunzii ATCC 51366]